MRMFLHRTKSEPLDESFKEQSEEIADDILLEEEQMLEVEEVSSHTERIPVKGEFSSEEDAPLTEEDESWFQPEGELAIDVYQTDKDIVIQAAIAGIRPEDLDVSIENEVVTISGTRKNPNEAEEKQYFHEECFWGPFSRQIFLPQEVDMNRTDATMKDGVFTLRLPKVEREKTKKVKVTRK